MIMKEFSKDFVWGVATSSFQTEGALNEGGRGESIWDLFVNEPGRIWNDCKPEPSCDFYHRYKEDIALMKQMEIKAYRFSLSWPRILPEGVGKVNEEGVKFYKDVIDELTNNGIEPYITMYHWDYPEALQRKGGWVNPESVEWFSEYAKVVAESFSDKVKYFITLNEPQCFSGISFLHKEHAPALELSKKEQFLQVHNMLKAHGLAARTLRKYAHQPIKVGFAPTCGMPYPLTDSKEDIEAARQVMFSINPDESNWTWTVAWFSDPVFLGKYPEDGLKAYKDYLPEITKEDMELISTPLDFMGENIYNGYAIKMGADGKPEFCDRDPGYALTGNDWPMTPECFYWGLKFLYERYKTPIYVTENGTCVRDWVSMDGRVHDPQRIDFLKRYIQKMKQAIDEGVDIRGYFEWTLTDNFEWNLGYRDRFGMVYVDFTNGRRIRKDSSYFYEEVIKSNGGCIMEEKQLLFFKPVFKTMIWGGKKMKDVFNYDIPADNTGECWAISAHQNGDCVCETGEYKGKTLSHLWKNNPELFGNLNSDRFPLLLKVIDAKDDLSIQVHPSDEYAMEKENGSLGKTECWYILDCEDGAKLVVGHNAKTKEELCSMIDEHRFKDLIREVSIRKGDFVQINPGTVHAIKGGVMILETQQNSDITYRVYDYDRLQNGKPRELHIAKSKDVITVPAAEGSVKSTKNTEGMEELVTCKYYSVYKVNVEKEVVFDMPASFEIVSCVEGYGEVNGTMVKKGDHFIVPSGYGKLDIKGKATFIISMPR